MNDDNDVKDNLNENERESQSDGRDRDERNENLTNESGASDNPYDCDDYYDRERNNYNDYDNDGSDDNDDDNDEDHGREYENDHQKKDEKNKEKKEKDIVIFIVIEDLKNKKKEEANMIRETEKIQEKKVVKQQYLVMVIQKYSVMNEMIQSPV